MINNLVTCWRIKTKNNRFLCFTDSDYNILYEDEIYKCGSYFTPSSIISSNELAQDNFSISGIIDNEIINEKDLLSGEFSNSYLEIFLVDADDLLKSKITLKTGWLGEIKITNHNFIAEVKSLGSKTNNIIGRCYSSSCRAEFGDKNCKVNKDSYSYEGKITMLSEDNSFIDESREELNDYFAAGMLTFIDGEYKHNKYTVSVFKEGKISLDSAVNLKLNIGDRYKIMAGCDKSIDNCVDKFNNILNFRGEPFIPSRHKLIP